MGSFARSKKRIQVWKKALFHFSLCFVMGFFTGFAPTNAPSIFSASANVNRNMNTNTVLSISIYNQSSAISEEQEAPPVGLGESAEEAVNSNRSLKAETHLIEEEEEEEEKEEINPKKLIIIITPTRTDDPLHRPFLSRLGHTLKLVPPPLLWIVVEKQTESNETNKILRNIGIMYRHLVSKENFTNEKAEAKHLRNIALNHIEHHRLDGIVHFAQVSNVYDLEFFDSIRDIGVLGTWPIAVMSPTKNKVAVEGPVCSSSRVMGWHLKSRPNNGLDSRPSIPISSFAFSSSVLWDPERWGRTSSVQATSQDSMKFVKQIIVEDETKLKGIPEDCSKVMLWHLRIGITHLYHHNSSQSQNKNTSEQGI